MKQAASAARTIAAMRCRLLSLPISSPMAVDDDLLQLLEMLDDGGRSEHDRVERTVGDEHRDADLVLQPRVEPAQQGPAAGEHDAALDEVAREFGWAAVQCGAHRGDDAAERQLHRLAQLLAGDGDVARQAGAGVAPADLRFAGT